MPPSSPRSEYNGRRGGWRRPLVVWESMSHAVFGTALEAMRSVMRG